VLFDLPDFKKEDTLAGAIEALLQTRKDGQNGLPKLRSRMRLARKVKQRLWLVAETFTISDHK